MTRFVEDESYIVNYEEYKSILDKEQEKYLYLNEVVDLLNAFHKENEQLKKYCIVLKNQIKKMGEIGGFNKHMIKTILESNYDD